jgi:hypothetical protein
VSVVPPGKNENLCIVKGAWRQEAPKCTLRRDRSTGVKEKPLKASVAKEVCDAVLRAYEHLKLQPTKTRPDVAQDAIYETVNRVNRSAKRITPKHAGELAISLGCLWGQTVCDAKGWIWRALTFKTGETVFAIVDPKRTHVVAPMGFLLRMLRKRGENAENTTLLLYNMIKAGELHKGAPKSYKVFS